jgi:predicted DNA-binding ribbon-helix-helix protein
MMDIEHGLRGELEAERLVLIKANRDIAEGEQRICEQTQRLATLRREGDDMRQAVRLEQAFSATLEEWKRHRELIQARIVHLEQCTRKQC